MLCTALVLSHSKDRLRREEKNEVRVWLAFASIHPPDSTPPEMTENGYPLQKKTKPFVGRVCSVGQFYFGCTTLFWELMLPSTRFWFLGIPVPILGILAFPFYAPLPPKALYQPVAGLHGGGQLHTPAIRGEDGRVFFYRSTSNVSAGKHLPRVQNAPG